MSLRALRGSGPFKIKTTGRKSTAKDIKCYLMLAVLAVFAIQCLAFLRYAKKTTAQLDDFPAEISIALPPAPKIEYIMWAKDDSYTRECEIHYKGNHTWGKLHAPYVDKIEAKNIVERMKAPSFKIIPTLAVLDEQNFTKEYTLEFLQGLKQPYIIKSSHTSGGVARVFNNKYHCFKYCVKQNVMRLDEKAFQHSKDQFMEDLHFDYSKLGSEMQYRYITPHIIIEEDIISGGKSSTDVTFWWISNGHPVFVSEQCEQPQGDAQGFQMKRIFVGTDHRRLPIVFNRDVCKEAPPKPKSWDKQLEIVKEVGKSFPSEVVRVDVYGGGDDVWFSELTFTTAGCWKRFTPALTDGLLYGLMKKRISRDFLTPENVERLLTDKSWIFEAFDERNKLIPTMHGEYPSPVDLCQRFEEFEFNDDKKAKMKLFNSCIQEAKSSSVHKFSLRCIISENNGTKIHSFGVNQATEGDSNLGYCAEKALELVGRGHNLKRPNVK